VPIDLQFNFPGTSAAIELLPEKAAFLIQSSTLLIADPHFGKATHFRKAGIPIPEQIFQKDLDVLEQLILRKQPENLTILGDFFHSDHNPEWEAFLQWKQKFPQVNWKIVVGNHDRKMLPRLVQNDLVLPNAHSSPEGIYFSHEPDYSGKPTVCGHIHPGFILKGAGRQKISLPCFFLHQSCLILPAFGAFTGLSPVKPMSSDRVFIVNSDQVIEIQA
jgi:DNA ligase-associated metallophosphoesterase